MILWTSERKGRQKPVESQQGGIVPRLDLYASLNISHFIGWLLADYGVFDWRGQRRDDCYQLLSSHSYLHLFEKDGVCFVVASYMRYIC